MTTERPANAVGDSVLDPPGSASFLKGKMWWTSVWPLFAVSVLISVLLQEVNGTTGGQRGFFGVGGVGALVLGTMLSRSFEKRPAYRFWDAFRRALQPLVIFFLVAGCVCSFPRVSLDLERQGVSNPNAAAMFGVFIETIITVPVLAATWAFFVVRKANKLAARALQPFEVPACHAGDATQADLADKFVEMAKASPVLASSAALPSEDKGGA